MWKRERKRERERERERGEARRGEKREVEEREEEREGERDLAQLEGLFLSLCGWEAIFKANNFFVDKFAIEVVQLLALAAGDREIVR